MVSHFQSLLTAVTEKWVLYSDEISLDVSGDHQILTRTLSFPHKLLPRD